MATKPSKNSGKNPGTRKPAGQPDKAKLSARQRRILEVITDAVVLRGYPPSIREIGDAAGLQSTSSVAYQLKQLEEKGFLRRDPNKPRAVDVRTLGEETSAVKEKTPVPEPEVGANLIDFPARSGAPGTNPPSAAAAIPADASAVSYIPCVGQIAAGAPITAEQNVDFYFPMPTDVVGEGDLYMLKVQGDSMKDAGILNDDWVIVKSQNTAENGDFVAALLEGEEATVKEFFRDSSGVWLLPHNEDFAPINGNNAQIMGKVVSVFRKL